MHLADVRHVDQGIDAQVAHPGAGFFHGFAYGGLLDGLAVFHEAGGQGPETQARLDGTTAQQHLIAPHRYGAGDDIGVLVVNGLTVIADITQACVAFGNALGDWFTALAAEVHAGVPGECAYLGVTGYGLQVVV